MWHSHLNSVVEWIKVCTCTWCEGILEWMCCVLYGAIMVWCYGVVVSCCFGSFNKRRLPCVSCPLWNLICIKWSLSIGVSYMCQNKIQPPTQYQITIYSLTGNLKSLLSVCIRWTCLYWDVHVDKCKFYTFPCGRDFSSYFLWSSKVSTLVPGSRLYVPSSTTRSWKSFTRKYLFPLSQASRCQGGGSCFILT